MSSARSAAIATILAVDAGVHAQAALNTQIQPLPAPDRQLCADIVYGALRNRIRIQCILGKFLANPAKLPAAMLVALETALYSCLFQDKVPAYAILNETVEIVKKKFGRKMANVANGVLRAILRAAPVCEVILPPDPDDFTAEAAFYSLPREIAELWRGAYGYENAMRLARRSAARPYAGLRINPSHAASGNIAASLAATLGAEQAGPGGFAFAPGKLPALVMGQKLDYWQKQGALSLQAAASQIILEKLDIYDAWRRTPVWDACAGSGGKTLALLERGLNVALVSDASLSRLRRLQREAARLGLAPPAIFNGDATAPPIQSWSGNILVDAPCSGLGVLARRPDIKTRWNKAAAAKLAALQGSILESLYQRLISGGEICYITCSLNPAENEEQISALRARHPELELKGQWQTPHEHPWLEGMFGARIKKN